MNKEIIHWLLTGEAWVSYRTHIDILDRDDEDKAVEKWLSGENSIQKAGMDVDFRQKESPSKWITIVVFRIGKRLGLR